MSTRLRSGEIRGLTGIRGVAAIGVASYHLFHRADYNDPLSNIVGNGYLFVDLFFVLSGFVMALTYGHTFVSRFSLMHFRQFLWARVARIYPLYAILTLCSFVLLVSGISRVPRLPHIEFILLANLALVQNLGLAPSLDEPCWSISVEFVAYLAFPLIAAVTLSRHWILAVAVFLLSAVTIVFISQFSDAALGELDHSRRGLMDIWHYSSVAPILRCLGGFCIGVVVYRCFRTPLLMRLARLPGLGVAVLIAILILMAQEDYDLYIIGLFPALILTMSTSNRELDFLFGNAIIHRLGVYSFAIYLLHPHFRLLFEMCERHIPLPSALAFPLGIAITLAVLIGFTALAYHLIEKPARRLIRFEKRTVEAHSV